MSLPRIQSRANCAFSQTHRLAVFPTGANTIPSTPLWVRLRPWIVSEGSSPGPLREALCNTTVID